MKLFSLLPNLRIAPILGAVAILLVTGCGKSTSNPSEKNLTQTNRNDSVTHSAEAVSLSFGVYTADKPSAVVAEFAPALKAIEAALSSRLKKPVAIKMRVFKEYEEGIDKIADGEVDISRLGPASYIVAADKNPNMHLLAMESKKGARVFNGIIAVHKNSKISDLSDLKGKSFAFGDKLSTIGRYLSQALLLRAGLKADDFERHEFLGRHDTVGMAVAAGDFTAGALKEKTFKELVGKGQPLKVLVKFDNVTKPWVARSGLDPEVVQALTSVLLEMEGAKVASVTKDGFLDATPEFYQPVRDAIKASAAF